jgi:hypothetical protein
MPDTAPNGQKFFGSFFQKRTAFFLFASVFAAPRSATIRSDARFR